MKKIYILFGMALMVWLIFRFPHFMINPGELMSDHQKMNNKCMDCHDPFWGISSEKCISCHKLSEIGIEAGDTGISFHSRLADVNCTSCHTDHKGLHPAQITGRFDHNMVATNERSNCSNCHDKKNDELHNLVSTDCGSCHSTDGWKSSATFNHDMIKGGDQQNCSSCHHKPADSYHQTVTGNCSDCHTTQQWVPSTFDHSQYFVFDKHHDTQCSTCHTTNNYSEYTCYGCHEHNENNIRNEHQEEGIMNFSDCASCHHSGNEDEVEGHGSGEHSDHNGADQIQKYLDQKNGEKEDDDDDD